MGLQCPGIIKGHIMYILETQRGAMLIGIIIQPLVRDEEM